MYRGNNIIGFHRVAAPPTTTTSTTTSTTTTSTTTSTTTTTTPPSMAEIYFGSVTMANEAVLAVNNQNGMTFDIKILYFVEADCDNEPYHTDPVQSNASIDISTDGGASWTGINSVTAGPLSNILWYDIKIATGYTTVTGISNVPNVMLRGTYSYSGPGPNAENGAYSFTIVGVTAHTGTAIIICDDYANAGGTNQTITLSCTIAPTTTTTTTTAGPTTTTTTTTTAAPTTTTTTTAAPVGPGFQPEWNSYISWNYHVPPVSSHLHAPLFGRAKYTITFYPENMSPTLLGVDNTIEYKMTNHADVIFLTGTTTSGPLNPGQVGNPSVQFNASIIGNDGMIHDIYGRAIGGAWILLRRT